MRRTSGIFAIIVLCLTPLVAAQPSPPPDEVLRTVLDLNEEQLQTLHGLIEARRAALGEVAQRLTGLRAQLEEALAQPEPDRATVGSLVIGIRATERQAAQHQETFRRTFQEMLTDEQRERAEMMRFVRAALLGGTALDELGL